MSRSVTGQYEQRVQALVNVINADIAREGDRIGARLATMKNSLKDDNNFRNVVVRGADRSYVLDLRRQRDAHVRARLSPDPG